MASTWPRLGWLGLLGLVVLFPSVAEPVTVEYFGLPTCHDCREFLDTTWGDLSRQAEAQGLVVTLVEYDILDPESFGHMKTLLEARQVPFTGVPVLVVGTRVLQGDDLAPDRLGPLLGLATGPTTKEPSQATASESEPVPAPSSLTWAVVLLAGLVDGINPCVLTLLVFLLSVWKLEGTTSLLLGLAYTAGVFACYTAVGLGLLHAAALAQNLPWAGAVVSALTMVALALLTGFSLWDAWLAHQGQPSAMTLKLPRAFDQGIRALIRRGRGWVGLPAAFVLGAGISLLEFVCTGQVYLPTLVYLNQTGEQGALVLLLAYNLAFIVPLLVVFGLVHWGTGHRVLVGWAQTHLALSKVLLAGVYGLLGLALWLTL